MPDQQTVVAIVLMALTTYTTRVAAYLVLRNRVLSPRMMAVLQSSPGCVMLAFITPFVVSGDVYNLIVLSLTVLCACRFSMPVTVVFSVGMAALFRHFIG